MSHAQLAGAARIGPSLQQRLDTAAATDALRVIVTFRSRGAPTRAQLATIEALGLSGVHLRSYPMAGVAATPEQVRRIAALPGVRSVYEDAPLQYENDGATRITGVQKLRADAVLTGHNGGMPYTGKGVTVLVNDSGIDGTHADLLYPGHVIQNVYAGPRGAASGIVAIDWIEDVPNTDFSTSHGTHVAGIVGATGERSGGLYRGVASGANLIGYGSGAALFVLDALGGFDYAKANAGRYGIRVVTNSFGNTGAITQEFDPEDPTNIVTQDLAENEGMVIVFSAGNSGNGENTITGTFKKAPWVIVAANGTKTGTLAPSSSRGKIAFGGSYTDPETGVTYALTDRPTVITPGTSIVSTRAASTDPLAFADSTSGIATEHVPFYTIKSGTSMSAPHVTGIVALMLEANPALGWREVKAILEKTATNVADLGDWEGGAGYANAYAAVAMAAQRAGSAVQGQDYGATNKLYHAFNARAITRPDFEQRFTVPYVPANTPVASNYAEFAVAANAVYVLGIGNVDPEGTGSGQTMRVALQDPDGVLYSPSVPIPGGALSGWRTVIAPAKPGTWKVLVRGTCGLSGTVTISVCTEQVQTNGLGAPAFVDVLVKTIAVDRYEGLADIAGHPARGAIERAVFLQLVDGRANGRYQPDVALTRIELAEYLALNPGLRQSLPLSGVPNFRDLRGVQIAYAEAAAARGGMLADPKFDARAAIETSGSKFSPDAKVSRLQLAYSLVQSLGLEAQAAAHAGPVLVTHDGAEREVGDLGSVPAGLWGYVQIALDRGLLEPVVQVAKDGTVRILFKPAQSVTRAQYAQAALVAATAYAPR